MPEQPNGPMPVSQPIPVVPTIDLDPTKQSFDKRSKALEGIKPGMSPQDILDLVINKEADDFLPWEECVLPSRGIYYNGKIPNGIVQVRAMGIYADKILATQRLAKSGKSLDWLYRKCVRLPDKDMDVLDLLANDRTFLLYYLRGITHGNEYDFMVECTNSDCGELSEQEYDLNKLATTIKGPNSELGTEPFKVVLPYMSEITKQEFWVKLRFLRGHDVWSMLNLRSGKNQAKELRNLKRKSDGANVLPPLDETLEQNLNLLISEVMGSKEPDKIQRVVERLHASDTATIREFLREFTPGIDTTVKLNCPYCKNEMAIDLPITDSFFRPKRTRDLRT